MTTHNSRNASNSMNESNNRTANTVGTPAKVGMLAKVVKPATACREANYSRDTVNIRDDGSSRDIRNIMDVNSSRSNGIRQYRKVSNNREDSKIQQGRLQQEQDLTIRTLTTAAETLGTAEGGPATSGMPDKVEMPTVLASSQTPTAQYIGQQLDEL
jgi:hypothetical protein